MTGILDRQVAIVTGGGRGFGRAIAERLAREGAAVAVLARSRTQLDEVVAGIAAQGGRALAVTCDVTDGASVARAVDETEAAFGPITLLVNNAGVPGPFGPLFDVDPDRWWAAQAVHIKAPMLFLTRILPGMVARRRGRVILVSAKAARMVAPFMSAYCTGKIAQTRLVEEVAVETRDHDVQAFAIDPGFVYTALADETAQDAGARKYMKDMVGRLGTMKARPNASGDLEACAQRCVDLASGRYDALSGRYLELPDDLDAIVSGARPHWQKDGPPIQPAPELS